MTKQRDSVEKADARLEALARIKARLRDEVTVDPSDPSFCHVADMVDSYPLLHVVLHAHLFQGGPEKGGRITIWGEEDGLGAVFNIPSLGVSKFYRCQALQELLLDIEKDLESPDTKWRKDKAQAASKSSYGKGKGRTR